MKLKNAIISAALALASLLAAGEALAVNTGQWNSTIQGITPCSVLACGGNGYVYVTFSTASTGGTNCGSGWNKQVIVDTSNAVGAYAAALAMSARLSGATVTAAGTGTCTLNSSIENLATLTY